jgi:hypothetical protein
MVADRGECELHGYMRRGRFVIFWSLGGGMMRGGWAVLLAVWNIVQYIDCR